jgi:hypothetical protein
MLAAVAGNAATITLPAAADTTILPGANADRNFGGAATFATGQLNSTSPQRSVLRFDLSGLSGQYSSIDSITLRLYVSSKDGALERNTEAHEITAANAAWVEGTNVSGTTSKTGASWLNMSQTHLASNQPPANQIPWVGGSGLATAGTAYNSTLLASHTFAAASILASGTPIDFGFDGVNVNLTTLVDGWIVSMPGLLLFDSLLSNAGNNFDRVNFHSKEATTASFRPELIVEFQPVPEPQSVLLTIFGVAATVVIWRLRANDAGYRSFN